MVFVLKFCVSYLGGCGAEEERNLEDDRDGAGDEQPVLRARAPGQGRALHAAAPHHCAAGCPRSLYQRRPDDVHSARQPSGLSPLSAAPLPHFTQGTRRRRRSPVRPARAEPAAMSARGCAEAPAPGCARASECAKMLCVHASHTRCATRKRAGWRAGGARCA
jgi:hypothetical protein